MHQFRMPRLGEHEIKPHPRAAWRAFVAGCVAIGLLLLGLIIGANAGAPAPVAGASAQGAAIPQSSTTE
jgi:hypothetical protein